MNRLHCDLCGEEITEEPNHSFSFIVGKMVKMDIRLDIESLISKKDIGGILGGVDSDWVPSFPEYNKQEEGYDACVKCWQRIIIALANKLKEEVLIVKD